MSQANVKIISHPSIRVKGTENDFDPVNCNDAQCSIKSCHMHCPFCIKSESYHDSRILKAHYHVKHVDKGIEFGGLKILRCCEKCDIIGVIKEEKKFKGAHWHCFICKNGFNRRDEAVKHYKTHFRNPCTTLQIHVPQEVNKAMAMEEKKGEKKDDIQSPSIHIVSEAVISSTTPFLTAGSGMSAVILKNTTDKANDGIQEGEDQGLSITTTTDSLIQPLDNPTAIMIIQEDQLARSSDTSSSVQSTNSLEEQEIDNKWQLGKMVSHLQDQLDQLQAKKDEMERQLREEIGQLKSQVHRQTQELELLQQKSKESSNLTSDSRLQQLVKNLQQQHTEMLQQHLKQVKQEVYQYALKQIQGNTATLTSNTSRDNTNSTVASCDQTVLALFLDSATGLLSQTLPVSLPSTSQTTSTSSETGNQVLPISIPLSLQSPYLSDGLTVTSLNTRANMSQSSLSTVSASTVMNSAECPAVANSSPSIQPSSKINSASSIYNPCLPSIQQLVHGVAINGDKSTDQTSNDKKLLIAIPSTLLSTPVSTSTNQQGMISTIHPSQATFASIDSAMISTEATNSSSSSFLACSTSFAANCPTGYCTSEVTSFDNNTSYIITEGSKHCPLQLTSNGSLSYSELLSAQTAEKRKLNMCDGINIEKRRK